MAYPFFEQFGASGKSLDERRSTVGGSDINIIAAGDAAMINKLYEEKVTGIREDLSMVWPIIMGHITEDANTE